MMKRMILVAGLMLGFCVQAEEMTDAEQADYWANAPMTFDVSPDEARHYENQESQKWNTRLKREAEEDRQAELEYHKNQRVITQETQANRRAAEHERRADIRNDKVVNEMSRRRY